MRFIYLHHKLINSGKYLMWFWLYLEKANATIWNEVVLNFVNKNTKKKTWNLHNQINFALKTLDHVPIWILDKDESREYK